MRVGVQKLSDQVTRRLARQIVAGIDLDPARLPTEQEICEAFDVSKTVAREAVARLEAARLVTVRHGRRMTARPESEWDYLHPLVVELQDAEGSRRLLTELTDIRLLIEPEMAARAASHASESNIALLGSQIDTMRRSRDDPDAYTEVDIAFHQEIMRASGNRVIAHIVDSIRDLMRASRQWTNVVPQGLEGATEGHVAIFKAVRARDASGAREAMRDHILWGSTRAGLGPVEDLPRTAAAIR
jgi:DNA-binding FadR family transcriptional regulator